MKVRSIEETIMRRQRLRMIMVAIVFFVALAAGLMDYIWTLLALALLGFFLVFSYLFYNARTSRKARMYHFGRFVFGSLFILQVAATIVLLLLRYWGGR